MINWKQIRAFLGRPDIEVGQKWQHVSWSGNPFEEPTISHFYITEVRRGYAKGHDDEGTVATMSFDRLRYFYGLVS